MADTQIREIPINFQRRTTTVCPPGIDGACGAANEPPMLEPVHYPGCVVGIYPGKEKEYFMPPTGCDM